MSSHEQQSASSPSTMKSAIIFFGLVAVSLASPQIQDRVVALLRDDRVDQGDGNFNYAFAADNGLEMEVSGAPGAEGAVSMRGYYVLPLESGGVTRVEFVADGAGFQPSSDILPTPHPLPEHVRELLSIAEEFRRQGVQFDDQGRRIN
ncbi:cuticle protein AMP2-like [Macrobrachium rosenbergii]|uniref:cuticle protein AMP2-like n=1 Tax=Macrobrachium rosenbergii TaxID=79674 RepID=UPI0034D4A6ED